MDRNAYTRALWAAKLRRELTANAYFVGRVLLRRSHASNRCWPSLATIAGDVGCSVRTVSRSIAALRAAGLLAWEQRRVRWNRHTSNLYTIAVGVPAPKRIKKDQVPAPLCPTGPLPGGISDALGRLAAAMGVQADDLPTWLSPCAPSSLRPA